MRPKSQPFPLIHLCLAATLIFCVFQITAARAEPATPATPLTTSQEFNLETLQHLRAQLDSKDRLAALRALHIALSQLSDGATFVWRKKSRQLAGVIKPTMAFRDAEGRVCRHLIYSLSLGQYVKSIEGVACRQADGRWRLAG